MQRLFWIVCVQGQPRVAQADTSVCRSFRLTYQASSNFSMSVQRRTFGQREIRL